VNPSKGRWDTPGRRFVAADCGNLLAPTCGIPIENDYCASLLSLPRFW